MVMMRIRRDVDREVRPKAPGRNRSSALTSARLVQARLRPAKNPALDLHLKGGVFRTCAAAKNGSSNLFGNRCLAPARLGPDIIEKITRTCCELPNHGSRDPFSGFVENDTLDAIADITAIEHIGNVWQCHHDEVARIGRESRVNALFYCKERQRVLFIDPVGVTNSDANL